MLATLQRGAWINMLGLGSTLVGLQVWLIKNLNEGRICQCSTYCCRMLRLAGHHVAQLG